MLTPKKKSYKAVILIAGPQKGTRFRPLSLDVPKPLFPVAGIPMIQHHVEALNLVSDYVNEILILGTYSNNDLADFVRDMNSKFDIPLRYLQEYTALGTAGGLFHFRDRILSGKTENFFVMNGDVCADFPLRQMLEFHSECSDNLATFLATEATRQQSLNYGCVVMEKETKKLLHYVEKPDSFISSLINCGVYVFSKAILDVLSEVFHSKQKVNSWDSHSQPDETIWIERDVLPRLANQNQARVFQTTNWWSQIKTAGSAIYANRHYLSLYQSVSSRRLAKQAKDSKDAKVGPIIHGNVFIHPTAKIHPTAEIGPNVSIADDVKIGAGSRIKESIILSNSKVGDYSLILYTVIGLNTNVGSWTRVEGTPNDPNPNKPFAKMENQPLFNSSGKLNPSITILGCNVDVSSEIVVLNAIVLPHKTIDNSFKNEIVL